jgi:hypothetical protein
MIVIRVELWPHGDQSRAVELGGARIFNDGTGSPTRGNYHATIFNRGGKVFWKSGRVEGSPRKRLGVWDLIFRALRKIVGDRNLEKQERVMTA